MPFNPAAKNSPAALRWIAPSVAALALSLTLAACSSPQDRAAAHYKSGTEYLEKGDFAKAAIEFRNALKIDENNASAWFGMAQVEEQKLAWPRVAGDLKKVLELDPKHVEARLGMAKLLLLSGKTSDAMAEVSAAAAVSPDSPDVMAMKATILLKQGDAAAAVAEAKRLLAAKPGSEEAYLLLAAERRKANDLQGAIAFCAEGLKSNPKSAGLRLFQVQAYEALNDKAGVEAGLRDLVANFPEEASYRKALVTYFLREKRTDEAEKVLRATAAAKPDDIQANLDVVTFVAATKGRDAAEAELLAQIKARPDPFIYQSALAQLYFEIGQVDKSIALLKEVVAKKGISEQGIAARVDLAAKLTAANRLNEAEAVVKEIMDNDARNTGGFQVRATIEGLRGNTEAAIADLREALNNEPRDANLKRQLAQMYERSGSIELATKELADAVKLANFAPALSLDYARLLMRHGNPSLAEDTLVEASNRAPDNLALLKALTDIRLNNKDWAGAEAAALAMQKHGGDPAVVNQILSTVKAGQNKLAESVDLLKGVQANAPTEAAPMFQLARALVASGKTGEAEAMVRAAIAANPDNVSAYIILASIQLSAKQPDLAEGSLRDALKVGGGTSPAYRALGDYLGAQAKYPDAVALLKEGEAKFPDDMDIRISLGGWLDRAGDYDGAIAQFEAVIKAKPDSMVVANNLASLLSDHRTDKESLERAASYAAILRSSEVPQFQDTLGWAMFKAGDVKGAIPLLETAARLLPNVPDVNYHLGAIYAADGRKDDAAKLLKLALTLSPNDKLKAKIETTLKENGLN